MSKAVDKAIRGLGAEPHPDEAQREAQLQSLKNDFLAARANGEDVWEKYPDPSAAGFDDPAPHQEG